MEDNNNALKYRYELVLDAEELVLVDTLLNFSASYMNEQQEARIILKSLEHLLRHIGPRHFSSLRDKMQLLINKSIENDEVRVEAVSQPITSMLKQIFGDNFIEFDDEQDNEPPQDNETDPICPDCGKRHP